MTTLAEPETLKNQTGIDLLLIKRLFRLLKIIVPQNEYVFLKWYFGITLISALLEFIIYLIGKLPSEYFVSLSLRQSDRFILLFSQGVGLVLCGAVCKAVVASMAGQMSLATRRNLTFYLQHLYLSNDDERGRREMPMLFAWNCESAAPASDRNSSASVRIDNPDQRITEDSAKFADILSGIISKVILTPALIGYYSYQTWSVGGWIGPCVIYAYFLVSVIITRFSLLPLVPIVFRRDRIEAHFRYAHLKLRNHAESICIMNSSHAELHRISTIFEKVLQISNNLINWQLLSHFISNFTSDFGAIISYGVIGIAVFATSNYDNYPPTEIGRLISLNAFYCMYLINKFTTITDMADQIALLAGYTVRLSQLVESSTSSKQESKSKDYQKLNNENDEQYLIRIEQQHLYLLDGRVVRIPGCSIPHNPNSHNRFFILITGPSGSGKSTLLRRLSSSSSPSNFYLHPSCQPVIYLPQKPHLLINATLFEQLLYPDTVLNNDNPEHLQLLQELITLFNLQKLLNHRHSTKDEQLELDPRVTDWNVTLSPGEQQLVCIVRALLHKPSLLIMDEPTSSLNSFHEKLLFEYCKNKNISCLWISHTLNLCFGDKNEMISDKHDDDTRYLHLYFSQSGVSITSLVI